MPVEESAEVLRKWGAAISARRDELKLTQTELAQSAGVDQRTISAYEHGRFQPALDTRLAIAKALDTTHDTLFSVDEVVA